MSGPWFTFERPCACGDTTAWAMPGRGHRLKISGASVLLCRRCGKVRRELPPIGSRDYECDEDWDKDPSEWPALP